MLETKCYFITWTTYGTWLPGDARGWRHKHRGPQISKPLLERWSRAQMKGEVVLLRPADRCAVEPVESTVNIVAGIYSPSALVQTMSMWSLPRQLCARRFVISSRPIAQAVFVGRLNP